MTRPAWTCDGPLAGRYHARACDTPYDNFDATRPLPGDRVIHRLFDLGLHLTIEFKKITLQISAEGDENTVAFRSARKANSRAGSSEMGGVRPAERRYLAEAIRAGHRTLKRLLAAE
jgi:hypothetical protein